MSQVVSHQIPPESITSPLEPLPQYRPWKHDRRDDADLLEQLAFLTREVGELKRLRLDLRESQPDVEYIEFRLGELQELLKIVEHRKRLVEKYRNDPLVPSWPQGTGKIGRLASDLKLFWPLPKFCREMLLLDLQGRGDQLRACCPVPTHNDKSPSFVVFTRDDRWHCFGACGSGGDVYDLIRAIYGHEDFTAQVRMLAEETGRSMEAHR